MACHCLPENFFIAKKRGVSRFKMLTLQFIPFSEFSSLAQEEKLSKLLSLAKEEKILLLEGRLKSTEKSELISKTMAEIDQKFKGIEIEEVELETKNLAGMEKLKHVLANMLLGDRTGFTVIGPASVVKEIKKDPEKIQLLMNSDEGKKRRK
jgi:hypothetical protein